MKIAVLGAGLVGNAIVRDLAQEKSFEVTAMDLNAQALDRLKLEVPVKTVRADLSDVPGLVSLVAESDLVVCALPGFMGFETLKRLIEAGKNVVDISFFAEDPFLLDSLAVKNGVTAVVDCGVAPGLSNVIPGYLETQLDQIDVYVCYVGGLPKIRKWPYEYKAVFSPRDVLEEYTRPARLVEHGMEVIRPALSEVEPVDFPGVGALEAFNSDGLRTLRQTMKIPFMKEKTLRYPGHANLMRVFRESGFFGASAIEVDGQKVIPIALTSRLLFEQWKLGEGEEDFTAMRIVVDGRKDGKKQRHTFELFDEYDGTPRIHSMARTTGYTCSIVVRQIASGLFARKGICPPEFIGREKGCYENLIGEYAKRNIRIDETVTE